MTWEPSATLDALRERARMISRLRAFFQTHGYLEVETPVMSQHGITDVYLSNIEAPFRGSIHYLQTSPEYHMKRLLAAGSGPIFQLARVFRDDELGRWHNPEFTLLEWYHLDIDHHQLMDEMDALLHHLLACAPMVRKTYQQAFLETCALDPFDTCIAELKSVVSRFGLGNVLPENEVDPDQYLFLLMSHVVEPALGREAPLVAVFDFPVSQASLARVVNGVASRFEVYYFGVELANGFHELTDAVLQAKRFEEDREARRALGLQDMLPDQRLLQAMQHGLPACSGVALGVDRLLALSMGQTCLSSCLAFDHNRA